MTQAPPATPSPEIGKRCKTLGFETNYHDVGQGPPVLFIHGSGPGVSAWANWRGVIPPLSRSARVIAPDMAGFGYTEAREGQRYDIDTWVGQAIALLDELGIEQAAVVGNSFGGAIALHLALKHPKRVSRLVLMGAVSLSFPLTEGLDKVWGYTPSVPAMRELMGVFAHDKSLINDDLVQLRFEASRQRGMDKVYESLFPAPRQRWVEMLAQSEEDLARVTQPTLLVHGRQDQVIPLAASQKASALIPNADLLVYARCGHWTQIERRDDFVHALEGFLLPAQGAAA